MLGQLDGMRNSTHQNCFKQVCLNYGGSVNDVATKAVVAALKDTRVPKVEMVRRMFALPPKLT